MCYHKNLFKHYDEEKLFMEVFSTQIHRIKNFEVVSKSSILKIAHKDDNFKPLLKKLKTYYPGTNIDLKIFNKIRSLGAAMR